MHQEWLKQLGLLREYRHEQFRIRKPNSPSNMGEILNLSNILEKLAALDYLAITRFK